MPPVFRIYSGRFRVQIKIVLCRVELSNCRLQSSSHRSQLIYVECNSPIQRLSSELFAILCLVESWTISVENSYFVEQLFKDKIDISDVCWSWKCRQPHRKPKLEIKIKFHFAVNLAVKLPLSSDWIRRWIFRANVPFFEREYELADFWYISQYFGNQNWLNCVDRQRWWQTLSTVWIRAHSFSWKSSCSFAKAIFGCVWLPIHKFQSLCCQRVSV